MNQRREAAGAEGDTLRRTHKPQNIKKNPPSWGQPLLVSPHTRVSRSAARSSSSSAGGSASLPAGGAASRSRLLVALLPPATELEAEASLPLASSAGAVALLKPTPLCRVACDAACGVRGAPMATPTLAAVGTSRAGWAALSMGSRVRYTPTVHTSTSSPGQQGSSMRPTGRSLAAAAGGSVSQKLRVACGAGRQQGAVVGERVGGATAGSRAGVTALQVLWSGAKLLKL